MTLINRLQKTTFTDDFHYSLTARFTDRTTNCRSHCSTGVTVVVCCTHGLRDCKGGVQPHFTPCYIVPLQSETTGESRTKRAGKGSEVRKYDYCGANRITQEFGRDVACQGLCRSRLFPLRRTTTHHLRPEGIKYGHSAASVNGDHQEEKQAGVKCGAGSVMRSPHSARHLLDAAIPWPRRQPCGYKASFPSILISFSISFPLTFFDGYRPPSFVCEFG